MIGGKADLSLSSFNLDYMTYICDFELWSTDLINLKYDPIDIYGLFPQYSILESSIIQGKNYFIWKFDHLKLHRRGLKVLSVAEHRVSV